MSGQRPGAGPGAGPPVPETYFMGVLVCLLLAACAGLAGVAAGGRGPEGRSHLARGVGGPLHVYMAFCSRKD